MQAILQKIVGVFTFLKDGTHQTLILALATVFILGCQTMIWPDARPHVTSIIGTVVLVLYMVKDVIHLVKEKISAPDQKQ